LFFMLEAEKELVNLRRRIDGIDGEIAELLCKRFELVGRIALVKNKLGLPIVDRAREDEVLSIVGGVVKNRRFEWRFIEDIYKVIIDCCTKFEETLLDCKMNKGKTDP